MIPIESYVTMITSLSFKSNPNGFYDLSCVLNQLPKDIYLKYETWAKKEYLLDIIDSLNNFTKHGARSVLSYNYGDRDIIDLTSLIIKPKVLDFQFLEYDKDGSAKNIKHNLLSSYVMLFHCYTFDVYNLDDLDNDVSDTIVFSRLYISDETNLIAYDFKGCTNSEYQDVKSIIFRDESNYLFPPGEEYILDHPENVSVLK